MEEPTHSSVCQRRVCELRATAPLCTEVSTPLDRASLKQFMQPCLTYHGQNNLMKSLRRMLQGVWLFATQVENMQLLPKTGASKRKSSGQACTSFVLVQGLIKGIVVLS